MGQTPRHAEPSEPVVVHDGGDAASPRAQSIVENVRLARVRVQQIDPSSVVGALEQRATTSRWLRPVLYVTNALRLLVAAVIVLVTNWRLVLVEIVPAVWIGAITWDWRTRAAGQLPLPAVYGWAALAVMLLINGVNLIAYWCNATIAFTLLQNQVDLRTAFASARRHARVINTWALTVGALQTIVAVYVARTSVGWYTLALGGVAILQMYALVALPAAVAGQPRRSTGLPIRERVGMAALTGLLTGIAVTPGFLLNRLGVLLIGLRITWLGIAVLVLATVVQIAGTSSAHAVKLATKYGTPTTAEEQA